VSPGPLEIGAALAVLAAFAAAFLLVSPAAARRNLGILHPAIAWLALEAVFFGVGSIALALVDGQPAPALYVAGAALAAGAGTWLADRLSRRREGAGPFGLEPDRNRVSQLVVERGARRLGPLVLALAAVVAIVPTLVATGIPLLAGDITAARSEITGIAVQLVRVAVPALAAVWLLDSASGRPPAGRPMLAWIALAACLAFSASLGGRYLPLELGATVALAWLLSGRRLPGRRTIAVGLLAAAVFVGFGVVRAADRAAGDPVAFAVERTVSRLFLVQPRTLAALQERIPAEEPHFLGATWLRRVGPLIGREIPNLGYWIYPRVVEGEQATAGYAAPGLLGEAWANFGVAGLALFGLLGILCERLGALVALRRQRVVDVVAGGLAILFVARTHALGLLGLALLLVLVVTWRWLAGADGGLGRDLLAAARWRLAESPTVLPIN
jgi:hypothetical protein